jgi:hypothetical protein
LDPKVTDPIEIELKQASKVWYDIIHKFLTGLSFKRSNSDHAVFIKNDIFLVMYVDDLLLFGPNLNNLRDIQDQLKQRFKMTDLGQLSHYLGMEITISPDQNQLVLTQSTYLKKVLKQFGMDESKPVSISMKSGVANSLMSVIDEADDVTVK